MRYKQYEVWLGTGNGYKRIEEYAKKLNVNPYGDNKMEKATCYIASEIGMTLRIGKVCRNYNESWNEDVGNITVEISQVDARSRSSLRTYTTFRAPDFLQLAGSPLMDKAKQKCSHRVGLHSEPIRFSGRRYAGREDIQGDCRNTIVFEFKYRPKNDLEEKGITCRSIIPTRSNSSLNADKVRKPHRANKGVSSKNHAESPIKQGGDRSRNARAGSTSSDEEEESLTSSSELSEDRDGQTRKRVYDSGNETEEHKKDEKLHNLRLYLQLLQGQMTIVQKRQKYITKSVKDAKVMLGSLEFWQCIALQNQKEQLEVMKNMQERGVLNEENSEHSRDSEAPSSPPRKRTRR
ncbi:hypothetical protein PNOK_0406200 [Pyrrhoderma noxium]|uniref:Uncharacterized protein n=1 Tax=Pyrrhoderma noxium TaxID=2282107 RepID=A0A286UPN8_9AGAM|nr:hypothetical protein PNOK_0406200 [Pyrrhoderma noxium]